ncbi:MAG: hypothetical protein RJA52_856 [Bacteroidota bacterium]|jgi:hypothetical protein
MSDISTFKSKISGILFNESINDFEIIIYLHSPFLKSVIPWQPASQAFP